MASPIHFGKPKPCRPLLGPFVQVLPPSQQPAPPKRKPAPKAATVPARPAKRTK